RLLTSLKPGDLAVPRNPCGCGRRVRCGPQAFAARTAAENFLNQGRTPAEMAGKFSAAGRNATAAADSRAEPSAASSLLDDARASPSSRFLASDPVALATPSHTLFQQPARRTPGSRGCGRRPDGPSLSGLRLLRGSPP